MLGSLLAPSRNLVTPRGNTLLTKAAEHIYPNIGLWDEDLLREPFLGSGCEPNYGDSHCTTWYG
jgi:hypothetical protein